MIWRLIVCAVTSAAAAPLVSFESILSQPIDARARALRDLEPARVAALVKFAFDPTETLAMRWRAITTMGRLDRAVYQPALTRALASPDWFMRNAALIATLNRDRAEAITVATRALDDPALVVRTQAVRNLIHLDARAAEPNLWRAVNDRRNFAGGGESLWIRAHLAEALAKLSGPGRTAAFARLLRDPDPRLHRWAVSGLENSAGMRLTEPGAPVAVARRRWLARLGPPTI